MPSSPTASPAEVHVVPGRARDLGGFAVRRVLPSVGQRMVGPFTFFDEMGPASLAPGESIDVLPHPHIGLATVTYLFEGAIFHRDSLGSEQLIRPGDVNWMIAGRGIVHSERSPADMRERGGRLHGLQLWVALPREHEEREPAFFHHPAATLPELDRGGVRLRVLAGSFGGVHAPVEVLSPMFYVDARMPSGSQLSLPPEHEERALYVVEGKLDVEGTIAEPGHMLVLPSGATPRLRAELDTRLVLLGGAPLGEPRYIDWNFVSSSKDRLAQARLDWKEGRFPTVPGDERERAAMPE